ncbi:indole-3-pyruvate decarboxylase [Oxobacter pfennigii]|uniref:Alpha-keto-acid decarboxylase n=1 Tax=Oxobacter pfennigii TaxID=36849 RepID=A0A0P8X1Z6_9CLOT|nr:thiamine pyrophosphate-binding protein [Oxobacter pfennigii]KPU44831.1 indole-3-pyruvate decarboxylase [Oxobacter pfennigii]
MSDKTVGEYLFDCLFNEDITEIFGVPGDYNFPLLDILERNETIKFINCRNELNAGYAADGYSRIKGMGALITTFGVGELSAINAVAGSYSEQVAVIHIVGAPKTMLQNEHKLMHHTLLDGNYDVFRKIYESVTAYTAAITAENAEIEIPRAIEIAKNMKKPVYLVFALDIVEQITVPRNIPLPQNHSNKESLNEAVNKIKQMVDASQKPVLLSGALVARHNLQAQIIEIIEKMNMPVSTMMMGKGSIDESHKNYVGLYAGDLGNQDAKAIIESADLIFAIGTMWTDNNTGSFTANINPAVTIEIQPEFTKIGMAVYENILMADMLSEIAKIAYKKYDVLQDTSFPYDEIEVGMYENISAKYYYPKFQQFLKENDIVISDAGTFSPGLSLLRLPKGVQFIFQPAWGSIGYATPAALGAALAAKNRRILLFTGDGSFQFTVQAMSSIVQYGCKIIVFLLNNNFYTIEAYLNTPQESQYNNIPEWDYAGLLKAFKGDVFFKNVSTNKEFDEALEETEQHQNKKICFIEMNAEPLDAPYIVHKMHQMIEAHKKNNQP